MAKRHDAAYMKRLRTAQQDLYYAASNGQLSSLEKVIKTAVLPEVNQLSLSEVLNWYNKDSPGLPTALHAAVALGHVRIVKYLLEHGANPDVQNAAHETPLHMAAQNGDVRVVEALLYTGHATTAIRSHTQMTPLHSCASGQPYRWFQSAPFGNSVSRVKKHISTEHRPRADSLNLHRSSTHSITGSGASLLSDMGSVVSSDEEAAFDRLAQAGNEATQQARHVSVVQDPSPPWSILDTRFRDVAELLIEHGEEIHAIDDDGKTALHYACLRGHMKLTEALLTAGVSGNMTDKNRQSALHMACRNGNLGCVRILLRYKANPTLTDYIDWTPVHWAAHNGHGDIVEYICQREGKKAILSHRNRFNLDLPMHLAAGGLVPEATLQLMEVDSIHLKEGEEQSGTTILHKLALGDDMDTLQHAIRTAGLNRKLDAQKRSPLHLTCMHGKLAATKVLLASLFFKVNGYDIYQRSPLHYAVLIGHYRLVQLLLMYGADVEHVDVLGESPATLADRLGGHNGIARLFREFQDDASVAPFPPEAMSESEMGESSRISAPGFHLKRRSTISKLKELDRRQSKGALVALGSTPKVLTLGEGIAEATGSMAESAKGTAHSARLMRLGTAAPPTLSSSVGKTASDSDSQEHKNKIEAKSPRRVSVFKIGESHSAAAGPVASLAQERDQNKIEEARGEARKINYDFPELEQVPNNIALAHAVLSKATVVVSAQLKKMSKSQIHDSSVVEGVGPLLHLALSVSKLDVARKLIDAGVDIHAVDPHDGQNALHVAAKLGLVDAIPFLAVHLDMQLVDSRGRTPMHFACQRGHFDVLQALAQAASKNPIRTAWSSHDEKGATPLHWAVARNHVKMIKLLIRQGVRTNARDIQGRTPLHWACVLGVSDAIPILLDAGAQQSIVDISHGELPLHQAVIYQHKKCVKRLLRHATFDPVLLEVRDKGHKTVVHWTIFLRDEVVLRFIRDVKTEKKGNQLATDSTYNRTPLHWAVFMGDVGMLSILLEDDNVAQIIDAQDYDRNTALHLAVQGGFTELVFLLTQNGASVSVKNGEGLSPIELAAKMRSSACVAILIGGAASKRDKAEATRPPPSVVGKSKRKLSKALSESSNNDSAVGTLLNSLAQEFASTADEMLARGEKESAAILARVAAGAMDGLKGSRRPSRASSMNSSSFGFGQSAPPITGSGRPRPPSPMKRDSVGSSTSGPIPVLTSASIAGGVLKAAGEQIGASRIGNRPPVTHMEKVLTWLQTSQTDLFDLPSMTTEGSETPNPAKTTISASRLGAPTTSAARAHLSATTTTNTATSTTASASSATNNLLAPRPLHSSLSVDHVMGTIPEGNEGSGSDTGHVDLVRETYPAYLEDSSSDSGPVELLYSETTTGKVKGV